MTGHYVFPSDMLLPEVISMVIKWIQSSKYGCVNSVGGVASHQAKDDLKN